MKNLLSDMDVYSAQAADQEHASHLYLFSCTYCNLWPMLSTFLTYEYARGNHYTREKNERKCLDYSGFLKHMLPVV